MKILALDTATRTGYALYASGVISSGVFDCSIRTRATKTIEADHPGKRFHRFQQWLRDSIRQTRPDLIVYERIVGGVAAGGHTTLIQKGLEALVITEAYQGGYADLPPIPIWTFAAATIKKWAINSGVLNHESKVEVTRQAFAKFSDQEWVQTAKGPDDNQADALWILDLAKAVADNVWPTGINCDDQELTRHAGIVTAEKWSRAKSL